MGLHNLRSRSQKSFETPSIETGHYLFPYFILAQSGKAKAFYVLSTISDYHCTEQHKNASEGSTHPIASIYMVGGVDSISLKLLDTYTQHSYM